MFFRDQNYWLAAISMQRHFWLEGENAGSDRDFLINMLSPHWKETIWELANAYKVARNFPLDIRPKVEVYIEEADIQDFDSFVFQTRQITKNIVDLERRKGGRKFSPFSGVSKILWHRFPQYGFIFDDQTRIALSNNGLVVPFFEVINDWGGPVASDKKLEAEFLIFAAAFRKFCLPLYEPLIERLGFEFDGENLDNEPLVCANRILDKLLWIAGEDEDKQRKHLLKWTIEVSEEDREIAMQMAEIASCHLQH